MYTLLIVDDEQQTLRDIESHLSDGDYGITRIFKARCVSEALDIFEKTGPDLVLSDIEMSGLTGLDLLKIIRRTGSSVPFIFLTCHSEFEYLQDALRLGSCDYLLKPINYPELINVIRHLQAGTSRDVSLGLSEYYSDSDIAKKTRQYISDHLVDDIKISDIAEFLHWSESHIMKVFKKETGLSILEYITKTRIEKACDLLKGTDWNMSIISCMCGFSDSSYFTRVFKKVMNVNPLNYRKNERGE